MPYIFYTVNTKTNLFQEPRVILLLDGYLKLQKMSDFEHSVK